MLIKIGNYALNIHVYTGKICSTRLIYPVDRLHYLKEKRKKPLTDFLGVFLGA